MTLVASLLSNLSQVFERTLPESQKHSGSGLHFSCNELCDLGKSLHLSGFRDSSSVRYGGTGWVACQDCAHSNRVKFLKYVHKL